MYDIISLNLKNKGNLKMQYELNTCLLTGLFERKFGLINFKTEYEQLVKLLNYEIEEINNPPNPDNFLTYKGYKNHLDIHNKKYKLFCKLNHLIDDFNHFINEQFSKNHDGDSKNSMYRRLNDFINRVDDMRIPDNVSMTISVFLKIQIGKLRHIIKCSTNWGSAKNQSHQEKLLSQIAETWARYPMLRLGQLLYNTLPEQVDIFYVPDEKLIDYLKKFS